MTMRVDGDATLEALVSVIDVVRGDGCLLTGAYTGEPPVPDACFFFVPIVDVAPAPTP